MQIDGGKSVSINFPANIRIDGRAEKYSFYYTTGTKLFSQEIEVRTNYHPAFSMLSSRDTLGFVIHNPYKIPIYYTVLKNKKVVSHRKTVR